MTPPPRRPRTTESDPPPTRNSHWNTGTTAEHNSRQADRASLPTTVRGNTPGATTRTSRTRNP